MVPTSGDRRARFLYAVFRESLSGDRPLTNGGDAKLFLEAVQQQQPPSVCVENVISSNSGLVAIRDAVRADLSPSFVLAHTMKFLNYLSDPGIKALADGQLLRQILLVIADPPTLWKCLVNMFLKRGIPESIQLPFAWLALELSSLPYTCGIDIVDDIRAILDGGILMQSASPEIRQFGYRIQQIVHLRTSSTLASVAGFPGGRHDNDFPDFRKISIYPTTDEILSSQKPFYRTALEVFDTIEETRAGVHLDNQFRMLREDMVAVMREDFQVATGKKQGRHTTVTLDGLSPICIRAAEVARGKPPQYALGVSCSRGLEFLKPLDELARKRFLKNEPTLLKHQSFGALHRGNDIIAFCFIDRDIDLLCTSPPVVLLQLTDTSALHSVLVALKEHQNVKFTLVDTPVFAYEPVLRALKDVTELPLHEHLLKPQTCNTSPFVPIPALGELASRLQSIPKDPDGLVELPATGMPIDNDGIRHNVKERVLVDEPQLRSITASLTRPVTLVQGPPGTGKSFLGAHIVKYICGLTKSRVLVIGYTNHALNQFLEDLQNIGLDPDSMVRLGSKAKCSAVTASLLISEQKHNFRRSRDSFLVIDTLKSQAVDIAERMKKAFADCCDFKACWDDIRLYLEFSQSDQVFYEAFQIPSWDAGSGWTLAAGSGQNKTGPEYLYRRWMRGATAGVFNAQISDEAKILWDMPKSVRRGHIDRWTKLLREDRLATLQELVRQYTEIQERLETLYSQGNVEILRSKRIIGCTTTAAAKYIQLVRQAQPDVILVEEAGEILESHILTSLTPSVKQIILIGDHKQLRPKVNRYELSVESGRGFDLNRSLFERMIMQGAPCTTLRKQHRMAPEISIFPRLLTYPDLVDGPKTDGRPRIRGLCDRVVFLNHGRLETEDRRISDRRDPNSKASKTNVFEAQMVLSCVKYLAQQGYGTEHMVVLTPYLGQLRQLRDMLAKDHDTILGDLDAFELRRAGLLSNAAAKVDKTPLRLSTIDNYQGEECDIVIVSLTRSNDTGQIGFMKAPERLNVLLSRARNCLILIGNVETFTNSRQGRDTWLTFFEILKEKKHFYDGLPIRCEKHPHRTAIVAQPADFAKFCPDGGCAELCAAPLACGQHQCQQHCHRVADHSKVVCTEMISHCCIRQHNSWVRCGESAAACATCLEDEAQRRVIARDLKLEQDRLLRQATYAQELQAMQDEIQHQRRQIRFHTEEEEQKVVLAQHKADLANLVATAARIKRQKLEAAERAARGSERANEFRTVSAEGQSSTSDDNLMLPGSAREDWEHLKKYELASNKALDELMEMTGLEEVKQQFLSIKSKVDTAVRQDIALTKERFSCSLLGNPGTGKTTVARLYARFLTSVGVIAGSCFKETTGSSLAHEGVSGCKQIIDDMLNEGGGVLFIDEAYQLTSGNSHGGGGVLNYLLPEVENLTGKIVFVLAGYNKQMESFFAHNPGLPSRFPVDMHFADYTDDELLHILAMKIDNKYGQKMQCEDGRRGLYCRIVTRRIGRARGRDGFGNARTVENALAKISNRQATRLRTERRTGKLSDDFIFTKDDLIGPAPAAALSSCVAWAKLRQLIGLDTLKESVKALVDSIQQNYARELAEQPLIEYSLNKVFLGSPGTGKTTVAKLYGGILVDLGLLSKGEVVVKNPSDFVGDVVGGSEKLTKGILAATAGKVLVIDEAYGLYGGGGGTGGGSVINPFKTAVIDTIVAEMEDMFQNVNPGMARRFPIGSAFTFDDFTDPELRLILDLKLKQQGFNASGPAKRVVMGMLARARNRTNFGNAGEIDILLDKAKSHHQQRSARGEANDAGFLDPVDFDEDFDRAERSATNVRLLFKDTTGCDSVVELLEGYQETVRILKDLDMDADAKETIPFNFLFRGPPGTGKTTTARKMGKVFYDMGFLATAEVVDCSATDLIGQYVGQTGPKVQQLLDKALGRVLFVDEAYRLSGGHFAKEAIDELVDSTTKPKYHKKLVIILAGYEPDINQLMSANPGLTSRFPEVIDFCGLSAPQCVALLTKLVGSSKSRLASKAVDLDIIALETAMGKGTFGRALEQKFAALSAQENWASARDVQTIAKAIFKRTLSTMSAEPNPTSLKVTEKCVLMELDAMFRERAGRATAVMASSPNLIHDAMLNSLTPGNSRPSLKTKVVTGAVTMGVSKSCENLADDHGGNSPQHDPRSMLVKRDAGVSDGTWEQLQRDRRAEQEREADYLRLMKAKLKAEGEERDKIVQELLEKERQRQEEAKMRERLQTMGLCPVGYQWIKQAGGYRCAGGSHFMPDSTLP